jgi:hypothetical protein
MHIFQKKLLKAFSFVAFPENIISSLELQATTSFLSQMHKNHQHQINSNNNGLQQRCWHLYSASIRIADPEAIGAHMLHHAATDTRPFLKGCYHQTRARLHLRLA